MNRTGTKISPRLLYIGIGFFSILLLTIFFWPHRTKATIPKPEVIKINKLPLRIPSSVDSIVTQVTPMPTPKAQPTPCQECLDVLTRYLKAIHTGAGTDETTR